MKLLWLILLLLLAVAVSACDTPAAPLAFRPTRVPVWRPPTPFPTMAYATKVPTPGLPPGLSGNLPPAGNPVVASQYAPVQGKLQQELLDVEQGAAKVRGLEPTGDVEENFISKDQLRSNLLDMRDKTYTREDARQAELQLWLLRLIDRPSIGLYQLQADMLSNAIVGYYDPAKKNLFVLSTESSLDPLAKETLAHEYVHTLQDQHYDLQRIIPKNSNDTDGVLAAKSIVEGDATLSGLLYADEYLSAQDFKKLVGSSLQYNAQQDEVPNLFSEELDFPYTYGLDFVRTLYSRGGFPTVNKALQNPPRSTEQILHPDKYLSSTPDEPKIVGLPPLTDTLGAGWTYRFTETMGEFELGIMLKDNGIKNTTNAVGGWGGGQADLYENGSNSVVMLGTVWDTRQDAVDFETALKQSLIFMGRSGSLYSDGTRFFGMKRSLSKVFYAGGTEPTSVQKALDAVH
jgi:hypothetical protein